MDQFSKTHIEKIFGTKKTRIQEWMDRNLIEPSIKRAEGKGKIAIFSLNDLYNMNLFLTLITLGLSRLLAASCSNIDFRRVDKGKNEYGCYLFNRDAKTYPTLNYGGLKLSNGPPSIHMGDRGMIKLVIDLLSIKKEVDQRIKLADL